MLKDEVKTLIDAMRKGWPGLKKELNLFGEFLLLVIVLALFLGLLAS